ncbi:SOSS complex subunit B homolog isoform X1 [Prunus yedoensis var. nudiflora]|uniref:SOSS complex subunit B homolog isoform X1 n=1 Tax=Prunus yedoensis var. nudiflora TaxID=2094558 RepID=A0A314YIQ4_PRUYE|nr:SOSS complex subunit B homolog isoform X1 [Prunus yedoensis var. nudiflora]PQQ18804.1 SOSS complex subunit B homolog isoform X1 [Prunus yedoensis var. nudiflora]
MVQLKDVVPAAQNNINTRFILLDKSMKTSSSSEDLNKTCVALVADETAAVHFHLWGDECNGFEPGDIICLSNGIFSYNRNSLLLGAGKRGKIEKVGEFMMAFVETPNMSEIRWVPDPNNCKKYIQEAVISPHSRIFPPKY